MPSFNSCKAAVALSVNGSVTVWKPEDLFPEWALTWPENSFLAADSIVSYSCTGQTTRRPGAVGLGAPKPERPSPGGCRAPQPAKIWHRNSSTNRYRPVRKAIKPRVVPITAGGPLGQLPARLHAAHRQTYHRPVLTSSGTWWPHRSSSRSPGNGSCDRCSVNNLRASAPVARGCTLTDSGT